MSSNFTYDQKKFILDVCCADFELISDKSMKPTALERKRKFWQSLSLTFNATFPMAASRSAEQVKKLFENNRNTVLKMVRDEPVLGGVKPELNDCDDSAKDDSLPLALDSGGPAAEDPVYSSSVLFSPTAGPSNIAAEQVTSHDQQKNGKRRASVTADELRAQLFAESVKRCQLLDLQIAHMQQKLSEPTYDHNDHCSVFPYVADVADEEACDVLNLAKPNSRNSSSN